MGKVKSYRLAPQSPDSIQLRGEGTALHIDDEGGAVTLSDGHALKQGWSKRLPDGKLLEVRALRPVLLPELAILVDGKHVDDSPSHPRKMLKASAHGLLIGAALFTALTLTGNRPADRFAIAYQVILALGAILLLRRMYTGLVLVGIALLADFILIDLALFAAPGRHLIWPIVTRILFAAFFVRSFIALHDLRKRY